MMWLFPIAGLLSLIWFLIRVVPKPSRATYPCQRVAAPLASGFVVWLAGLTASTLAYRKANRLLHQSRYVLAGICLAVSVMAIWWPLTITQDAPAEAAFIPTDPPNSPMGVAKGIHPGRVVWIHDASATSWDGSTGNWWGDDNTDQDAVDYMISKTIQMLTGQSNDPNAWDAMFKYCNQARGKGDIGYQPGEKVVIKINMNNRGSGNLIDASPQMVRGMLRQLVYQVGVAQSSITVYDAQRPIGSPVFNCCSPEFPDVGYNSNIGWVANALTYSAQVTNSAARRLPRCVLDAAYMINMSILKRHDSNAAVTLCAKNHFGTIGSPSALHTYIRSWNWPMASYDPQVDIIGHKDIGGKTVLYLIDALYGGDQHGATPKKWDSTPFNDDWPSSIFASQDGVAIDSVGMDFLRAEWPLRDNADRYLHEAAQADNPPSGTVYDPEDDGTPLTSLGVHEHWNNPEDRQYSRNLGIGNGIELVTPELTSAHGPVENLNNGKRYDYIRHAIMEAEPNDQIVVSPGIYSENINFSGKSVKVSSIDPNDPNTVSATVIYGSNQAVSFSGGEGANCVLAGFTITGAKTGLYCSDALPTIINCSITANEGTGIKLWNDSNPTIANCMIAGNRGAGIEMWTDRAGRRPKYSYATITNCTIVGNMQQGILQGKPTVINSIIYDNGLDGSFAQIDDSDGGITYSDVQGGWPGEGNIEADPLFMQSGYWDDNGTPEDATDDFWVEGDYHLLGDSPCVNAGDPAFTSDVVKTDIDGEPRIIDGRVDMGCDEMP